MKSNSTRTTTIASSFAKLRECVARGDIRGATRLVAELRSAGLSSTAKDLLTRILETTDLLQAPSNVSVPLAQSQDGSLATDAIARMEAIRARLRDYRPPLAFLPGTQLITSLYDEPDYERAVEYLACFAANCEVFASITVHYEGSDGRVEQALSAVADRLGMTSGRLRIVHEVVRPTIRKLFDSR